MSNFLNQFPYSDFHEMNLDWILKELKNMSNDMASFIASNEVEYRGLWDITHQYERNDIVLDQVGGYLMISIQPVPAGIAITNEDYWIPVSPFKIDMNFSETSLNAVANKTVTAKFNSVDEDITQINSDIEDLNTGLNTTNENLTAETEARTASETNINSDIQSLNEELTENVNELNSRISDNSDAINLEINNRATADLAINARIDNIVALPEGSTQGDAELMDIRVGADGITYETAGDAVRDQITNTNQLIDDLIEATAIKTPVRKTTELPVLTTPGYMTKDGIVSSSDTYKYTAKISVLPGDVLKAYDGDTLETIRFITAYTDNTIVSAAGSNAEVDSYTVPDSINYVVLSIANNYTIKIERDGFELSNASVSKDGTAEVLTKNIYGMQKGEGQTLSRNIFNIEAELYATGKYVSMEDGHIILSNNPNYITYKIPMELTGYYFTFVRFGVIAEEDLYTPVGTLYENVTNIDASEATDGKYILFSFKIQDYPVDSYVVRKLEDNYYIPTNWKNELTKNNMDKVEGALSNGSYLQIEGKSAIKDGYSVLFKGVLTSFSEIQLHYIGTGTTNYIYVNGTNLIVKNNNNAASIFAHNLNIVNDITLLVQFIKGRAKILLISNGESYTITVDWFQTGSTVTYPKIISSGTVCSEATLETLYPSAKRPIWYFGDSYITVLDPDRWTYYLIENNFDDNVLLCGASGGSSLSSVTALQTLLKYGTPGMVVFATGMNDGSDDGDTPSSLWSNYKDQFIAEAEKEGIEIIFGTIPTTPVVNNEAKNTWIRNSGYRYIDFAEAVGANASGEWYSGMLSADNVHPTAAGAKALFTQALIDLPELML